MANVNVVTTQSGKNGNSIVINGSGSARGSSGVFIGCGANGDDKGVTIGFGAAGSSGANGAVVIGFAATANHEGNSADSYASVAIGACALVKRMGVSVGYNASAGIRGVAIGSGSSVEAAACSESGGVAIGNSAYAQAGSVVIGRPAPTSCSVGNLVSVGVDNMLGSTNTSNSVIVGSGNTLTERGIVVGHGSTLDTIDAIIIGSNINTSANYTPGSIVIGPDPDVNTPNYAQMFFKPGVGGCSGSVGFRIDGSSAIVPANKFIALINSALSL